MMNNAVKKIRIICIALLLIITSVSFVYEIEKAQYSSLEICGNAAERVGSVADINLDMQSEPLRVGQEDETASSLAGPFLIPSYNSLFWGLVLLPIVLFLLFFQDVTHDGFIAFRRLILCYMHAKDGRKDHFTIPNY